MRKKDHYKLETFRTMFVLNPIHELTGEHRTHLISFLRVCYDVTSPLPDQELPKRSDPIVGTLTNWTTRKDRWNNHRLSTKVGGVQILGTVRF